MRKSPRGKEKAPKGTLEASFCKITGKENIVSNKFLLFLNNPFFNFNHSFLNKYIILGEF